MEPNHYWSRERAQLEWQHVWTRTWHLGPREQELPRPGDAFLHTLGPESLLFLRQPDGSVRGLYNTCRHRGSRLLLGPDGPLTVSALRCPFHGWCYGPAGRLEQVPYRERFDAAVLADPARTDLRGFRVESFAGWLWFTLDAGAPDLATYLGPVATKLAAYRMERATIVDYKTFEFGCNWKTTLDAFNESYHFQTLHAAILAWGNEDAPITQLGIHSMMVNRYGAPSPLYPDHVTVNPALRGLLAANGIDPAGFGGTADDVRAAVQRAKRARAHEGVFPYDTLTDSQLSDAYHYLVFPSLHFNLFPEFYVAMRYRPHPDGDPEKMYYDFIMCAPLAPGETVPEYEHRVVRGGAEAVGDVLQWGVRQHPVVNQVLGEDVGLVEHVQRGQRSLGFDGPILGRDERRLAHFHGNLDALIQGRPLAELLASNRVEPDAHAGL